MRGGRRRAGWAWIFSAEEPGAQSFLLPGFGYPFLEPLGHCTGLAQAGELAIDGSVVAPHHVRQGAAGDAGFEVIYTGLHQTPEQIVSAAIQEDVDCVGLSILSGAHNTLLPRVCQLLKEKNADDIRVFGGGVIPEDDIPGLKAAGICEVFTPGTSTEEIVRWIRENVKPRA